jgi:TetR/AcrR family transcriptional repressor of nem operon
LDVAGTLFRERGFDGIGVADMMKQAGLTHGGFYGHFRSKDDLAAEITARVLGRKGWPERLTGTPNPSFAEVVRKYLSPGHREDAGHGCLLAALGSDVVRQRVLCGALSPTDSGFVSKRCRNSSQVDRRLDVEKHWRRWQV